MIIGTACNTTQTAMVKAPACFPPFWLTQRHYRFKILHLRDEDFDCAMENLYNDVGVYYVCMCLGTRFSPWAEVEYSHFLRGNTL